ncbi:MAG TPA: DUF3105 domain-containing protein [Kofleriaceae bacterium]|jgi:hypothetical protein
MFSRAAFCLVVLSACGTDGADEPTETMVSPCDGVLHQVPGEPGVHMPQGTAIEWSSNPPATGAHYPVWAGWDRSYTSLERGYYVHNLEHGGIVLLYNCPDGCPDVVAQLEQDVRDATPDPTCAAPVTKRMIIVPDPLLPEGVQVAADAWNTYYTASCYDPYVKTFMRTHYRHGPEDTCGDGIPFGGVPIDMPAQ